MKQLLLIRHAKSSWKDVRLSDRQRPLKQRGIRDAQAMGRHLRDCGYQPQCWLSSTAVRGQQTSQLLTQALGMTANQIVDCKALYTFEGARLLEQVRQLDDQLTRVCLVGHNPAIAELAELLTATTLGKVPTCAVLDLALDLQHWQQVRSGCGRLLRFDTPKQRRGPD